MYCTYWVFLYLRYVPTERNESFVFGGWNCDSWASLQFLKLIITIFTSGKLTAINIWNIGGASMFFKRVVQPSLYEANEISLTLKSVAYAGNASFIVRYTYFPIWSSVSVYFLAFMHALGPLILWIKLFREINFHFFTKMTVAVLPSYSYYNKFFKLGYLKQQKCIILQFRIPKVWNEGISRVVFTLEFVGICFWSLSAFGGYFHSLDGDWVTPLPLFSHHFLFLLFVSLAYFPLPFSYKDMYPWI